MVPFPVRFHCLCFQTQLSLVAVAGSPSCHARSTMPASLLPLSLKAVLTPFLFNMPGYPQFTGGCVCRHQRLAQHLSSMHASIPELQYDPSYMKAAASAERRSRSALCACACTTARTSSPLRVSRSSSTSINLRSSSSSSSDEQEARQGAAAAAAARAARQQGGEGAGEDGDRGAQHGCMHWSSSSTGTRPAGAQAAPCAAAPAAPSPSLTFPAPPGCAPASP